MIAWDGSQSTQLATKVAGAHWLVELVFDSPTGTQRFTTAPVNVTVGADTYIGLGANLSVQPVRESEAASAERVIVALSLVDTSILGATLGSVSSYRDRLARLRLVLLSETFAPVGTAKLRFTGRMEPIRIVRRRPAEGTGGGHGRLELPLSRAGMARARNYHGLRATHAQQQLLYPGDLGRAYLQDLLEKPALWLSRRFQEI